MIDLTGKTLRSQRLEYRLLCEDDKPALAKLLALSEVTEPAGYPPAKSPEEFDEFFTGLTRNNAGIAVLLCDTLIGYFHVFKYKSELYSGKNCVGVGFVIGKEYQGKGYGTEMLNTLTGYLLTLFDVCFADYFEENAPSKALIEKCGYSFCESYSMFFDELEREISCCSCVREKA